MGQDFKQEYKMDNWQWWKIINLNDIKNPDVPDRYLTVVLDGLGQTDIVISRGFNICVLFLNYWIVPGLNERNVFTVDNKVGAYIDKDNNLWVGRNAN